jgi:hypothetical protein
MIKKLAVIAASAAFAMSAFAAPKQMTNEMLDQVVAGGGGTDYCLKGNNGWGNGADGTNPGSFNGATSDSKIAGTNLTGANSINTNPTTSTGR